MVPKAKAPSFLLGRSYEPNQLRSFLHRLQLGFEAKRGNQHLRELIVQTCQHHLKSIYPSPGARDFYLGPVIVAAFCMGDENIFTDALELVTDGLHENIFSDLGKVVRFEALAIPENE